ncbi:MAG TPA: mercuric reductase [Terriglobia bacterium]|nr:mercuric reductase [Terriglobia bacterium]
MKYDAIVIGSGQGGNPLAYRLADLGRSVALIEEAQLGGTCINTGCTPTKTMVASAQVAYYARQGARWGVETGDVRVDLPAVVARKNKVVEFFRDGNEKRVSDRKTLHLYRTHARFTGPHQVDAGGESLESEQIFIDTGARPRLPALDGLDQVPYLTNASIMELSAVPEQLLVIGGGYVGLEFGQMFRRFGSAVTVVDRGSLLMPHEDEDVAVELQKILEGEGIRFLLNSKPVRVRGAGGEITLTVEKSAGAGTQNETLTGSHLLVATGRLPNTDALGLDRAGIEIDDRGYVKVNDRLETSVPGVWALGDVKGGPAFTHISYNDYQIIYGNLVEKKSLSIRDRMVPYAVFTDPQLGRVGLTEKQARDAGRKLKIGKIPMTSVARARERDETAGLMKLVVDAVTDKVLGAAILCTEGGEVVQILSTLMLADRPYTLLKGAIYIHPTLAEGFFALMDSVKPVD